MGDEVEEYNNRLKLKDYSSPYNFHVRQEHLTREYQIALENMSMLRDELGHCVRTEGVNQFVNCKELRQKYFDLCQDKYRGMLMPPGARDFNRQVPGLVAPPAKKED
jgi:hypothetical protein